MRAGSGHVAPSTGPISGMRAPNPNRRAGWQKSWSTSGSTRNQRGLKAFTVTIAPRGDGAAVVAESLKMPVALGQRMTADAYRWAKGNVGCVEGNTELGAVPAPEQIATAAPWQKRSRWRPPSPRPKSGGVAKAPPHTPATTASIKPRPAPAKAPETTRMRSHDRSAKASKRAGVPEEAGAQKPSFTTTAWPCRRSVSAQFAR